MMGWSPQCYIPSFIEISLPVPEKIFEGLLPHMGVVAILVMLTEDCLSDRISYAACTNYYIQTASMHLNMILLTLSIINIEMYSFICVCTICSYICIHLFVLYVHIYVYTEGLMED